MEKQYNVISDKIFYNKTKISNFFEYLENCLLFKALPSFILENKEIMIELSKKSLKYLRRGQINEKTLNNYVSQGILREG